MPGWILRNDDDPPVVLRLTTGTIKTIGRTARADFIVDAPLVSRVHCKLRAEASNQLVVEDLGSTNGTRVNGERVDRLVLKAGDILSVGRLDLVVGTAD